MMIIHVNFYTRLLQIVYYTRYAESEVGPMLASWRYNLVHSHIRSYWSQTDTTKKLSRRRIGMEESEGEGREREARDASNGHQRAMEVLE